ncbi:MAG: AMP-binding protein [Ectothiorhodospiraceae bacterium]|nr:AMP-binding protein [Ectothiorhodospiraceae bacterium]
MATPEELFRQMTADGDVALYRLDHWAETTPDKTFIHYGESGLRLSFHQIRERADRLAAGLASLDVGRGDRISVLTGNSLAAAIAMFACWRLGALYAPVNFNLRGRLLSYQINDTDPAVLITDPTFAPRLNDIADDIHPRLAVVLPADYGADAPGSEELGIRLPATRAHALSEVIAAGGTVPAEPLGPFDPATIIYTSGTTGPAKGVVLGHRWINQYTFAGRSQWNRDDVVYCDLPMYHVAGAYALLVRALWNGNTVGLWHRFSPSAFWDRIAECGATSCILLDVMVPWLMDAPERPEDRSNTLNKVHMQPLPANHHAVAQRFGFDFITCGFGQTESGSGFMAYIDEFGEEHGTPPELYRGLGKREYLERVHRSGRLVVDGRQPLPKGLMGRPSPLLDAAILDENDNRLPPGQVGQLAFRPRFPGLLLQEYLNKPEATLKAFRNLWFHTGDACMQQEDGSYRFIDRMGGYFRVRGENVSSFEVESVINAHEQVRATAAVPVPARQGNEDEIAVFVELVNPGTLGEEELRAYMRREMPRYMQPSHVRFVDALPVTPTSKVEKYKLKQSLLREMEAAPQASPAR